MVIGSAWKGHEDSRFSCSRDFCHSACPRAAQQQVCPRKEGWHISNELVNLGRCASRLVGSLRVIIITLPGLMDDMYPWHLLKQIGQAVNHGLIDGVRSLTATENQQSRSRSRRSCGGLKESLSHRHTGYFCMAEKLGGLLEVYSSRRDPACYHAVGESRHNIRLERQSRNSPHDSGHHRRA